MIEFAKNSHSSALAGLLFNLQRQESTEFTELFSELEFTKFTDMRLVGDKIQVTIEEKNGVIRSRVLIPTTPNMLADCVNLFHQKTLAAKAKHEALNQVVK